MSEENKNDEKIKVNVIRKPQSAKKPEAHDGDAEVEKKVIAKGKLLATIGANPAAAKELYDRGYSYVIFDSDVTTLRAVAYSHVDEFKKLMGK